MVDGERVHYTGSMKKEEQQGLLVLGGIFILMLLMSIDPRFIIVAVLGILMFGVRRTFLRPSITRDQAGNPVSYMNTIDVRSFFDTLRRAGMITVGTIIGAIVLVNSIVVIPAGKTGVYSLFGKVRDTELSSGIHLVNPLASIERMSIRTEQYTMSVVGNEGERMGDDSIDALTKEGLKVNLDITVLYHLVEDRASNVYREIGVAYPETVIRPEVRSAIRQVIATYEAKDIYSEKREEAVARIKEHLSAAIGSRGIEVESVLLRNVALPSMLTQAIESKLTAEQEAQRYDFVLQKETKEAERKRIEAEGQRDSQAIINESLSNQYLQYLYIQNLETRQGTIYVPYDLPLFKGL
jgi:regulator of protease activity HflC (stomatin/prohibitin superfamily)